MAKGWKKITKVEVIKLACDFALTVEEIRRYRLAWHDKRGDAKERGIPFLLTFEAWLKIWVDSGHMHERGCHRGQYCMARFGDKGPYDIGNVRICTVEENGIEKDQRPEIQAIRRRKRSFTPEWCKNISKGVLKSEVKKGKCWYTNGEEDRWCKESPGVAWVRGKTFHPSEAIRRALLGRHWYNNGVTSTLAHIPAPGFILGRLPLHGSG